MRILAASCLLLCSVAHAGFFTGNDLMEGLRENELIVADDSRARPYTAGVYVGYIAAIHDSEVFAQRVCAPTTVTIGQITEIVRKFLEQRPELWHGDADNLIAGALIAAFPCEKPPAN